MLPMVCLHHHLACLTQILGHKGEMAVWSRNGVPLQQLRDTRPNCKAQQPSGTNGNKAIELLASALLAICQVLDLAMGNQPSWLLPHMVCTGTTSSQPAMTLKAKCGWVY